MSRARRKSAYRARRSARLQQEQLRFDAMNALAREHGPVFFDGGLFGISGGVPSNASILRLARAILLPPRQAVRLSVQKTC